MRSVIIALVFIIIRTLVSITVLIVTAILEKAPKLLATGYLTTVRRAHKAAPNPAGNPVVHPARSRVQSTSIPSSTVVMTMPDRTMRSIIISPALIITGTMVAIIVSTITVITQKVHPFWDGGCITTVRSAHKAAPNPAGNPAPNPAGNPAGNPAVKTA